MKYNSVRNCAWANPEQTLLNCEVDFDDLQEEFVPFAAVASGDYAHTHDIFARAVAGEFGDIKPFSISPEEKAARIRQQRDALLAQVDALATNPLRWAELTPEQQQAWAQYRLALLAVPQQATFPESVTWPVKP